MTRASIETLARRFCAEVLLGATDAAVIDELTTPDVTDRSPGNFTPGRQGLHEHRAFLSALFGNGGAHVDETVCGESTVVVFWTLRGTHAGTFLGLAPTGRPVAVPIISVLRFRGDRVAEYHGHPDVWAAVVQMGGAVVAAPTVEP